jgi:recombination protein RecA
MTPEEIDKIIEADGGAIVNLGSEEPRVGRVPSRLFTVNEVLGGGYPRGRMTEIYGKEGSSKSSLALDAIASAQELGGEAILIDTENTFDPEWAQKHGVNIEQLRVVHPTTGELAYEITRKYLATGKIDIIVVDSVANIVPNAELEGEIADANIGLQARLNAKAMRLLTNLLPYNQRTAILLVNQIRGNVVPGGYGPSEITSGGKAIPFYCTLRMSTRRIEWIRAGEVVTGARFQVEVIKAKLTGMSNKAVAVFDVDFAYGLDYAAEALGRAVERGLIAKAGSWYTDVDNGHRVQGEKAVKDYIRQNLATWRERVK